MYWTLAIEFPSDPRFSRHLFQLIPANILQQALKASQQKRNLDSYTTARHALILANVNRGEDSEPFDDVSILLPHADVWNDFSTEKLIIIDRVAANEFMNLYKKLPTEVELAFTDWLPDIIRCAK